MCAYLDDDNKNKKLELFVLKVGISKHVVWQVRSLEPVILERKERMMFNGFVKSRASWLTVEEVQETLVLLQNRKLFSGLDGHQRQRLEDTITELDILLSSKSSCKIEIPAKLVQNILKCVLASQMWLNEQMQDLNVD